MFLDFEVQGKAVAKQSFRIGKNGFGFTPQSVKNYANWVRLSFTLKYPKHLPSEFFEKPIAMTINYYVTPPKSWSKKKQEQAQNGEIFPTVKPDCDNISKNICDALNGIAYPDDKQIVKLEVNKRYSTDEKVHIIIEDMNNVKSKYVTKPFKKG